jgi:hypothetical protein
MSSRISLTAGSLLLTATSILVAVVSAALASRVSYLDHLPLFNSMAAVMLALVGAAIVAAAVGVRRARWGRADGWGAFAVALAWAALLLLNP